MGTQKVVNAAMAGQAKTIRYLMGYDDSDASWQGNGTTKPSTRGGNKGHKNDTAQRTASTDLSRRKPWSKGYPPRLSGDRRLRKRLYRAISTVYVECLTLWHGRKMRHSLYEVANHLIRSLVGSKPTTYTMHGTTNSMSPNGSSITLDKVRPTLDTSSWPTTPTLAWEWRDGTWHPPSCPAQCIACRDINETRRHTLAPTGRAVVPCDPTTRFRKDTT